MMARSRMPLRRWLLLSSFMALAVFSTTASAQGKNNNNNTPTTNAPAASTNTDNNNDNSTPQSTATNTDNNNKNTDTNSSPSATNSNSPSSTGPSTAVITPTGTDTGGGAPTLLPTITGSSDGGASDAPKLTGLPTLSKTGYAVPTYPPPTPPPTQNAPFMQHSNLPSGTVFIAVGAILGAFGAMVLIWRAVVACLLHRSVKRAALAQHAANDKAAFPQPPAPFYKYSDRDSTTNLPGGGSGAAGRGVRRTHRGPTPSATPSQTNLFFSPTAPGASGGIGAGRESRYLPSGFYAAGAAGSGSGLNSLASGSREPSAAHGQAIGLSNLRPDSCGHVRAVGPSPPDSPAMGPVGAAMRSTPVPRNISTSSINLNRPPSGRAPSAYLDDLLDDSNPGFPPPFPPSGAHHQYNHSQSSLGKYGDR